MRDIAYGLGFTSQEAETLSAGLIANGFRFSAVESAAHLATRPALILVGLNGLPQGRADVPSAFVVAVLPEPRFDTCAEALRLGFNDVMPLSGDGNGVRDLLTRFFKWLDAARAPENLRPLADLEKDAILTALLVCRGQMSMAARRLGIGRSTLYRKVEQYGIDLH